MLDAGFSTSAVVALVAGATLAIGAAALLAMKAHTPAVAFTAAFVGLWGAYFLLTRRRERSVAALARLASRLERPQAPTSAPEPIGAPSTEPAI